MADNNATDAGGNIQQLIEQIKSLPLPEWIKWTLVILAFLFTLLKDSGFNLLGNAGVPQQEIERIVEERIREHDLKVIARENNLATEFSGKFYSTNAALARNYGLCIGYTDDSMKLNNLKSLNQSLTLKYSSESPSIPQPPASDRPPVYYYNREKYP